MPGMDRQNRLLQRLIEKAKPQSVEELQKLMEPLLGAPLPEIPEEEKTPQDKAWDLVDEAWDSSDAKGKKLAEQALKLWPDGIMAYEYLAAVSNSPEQSKFYLEKGVEIGRRQFEGEFRENFQEHFWIMAETRPYMRCLDELALVYTDMGDWQRAIRIWKDLLELNPNDDQGVRFNLAPAFLLVGDMKGYRELVETHGMPSTNLLFDEALTAFRRFGDNQKSKQLLKKAMAENPYVVPLLLQESPPEIRSSPMDQSGIEAATLYAGFNWRIWQMAPGARQWLEAQLEKEPPTVSTHFLLELSGTDMQNLFKDPFGPHSQLKLSSDLKAEEVMACSFLRLVHAMLSAIQEEKSMKLTQTGNLPRKLVQQLYDLKLYPLGYIEKGYRTIRGIDDFLPLYVADGLCGLARVIKKQKGKVSLTKKGTELLGKPELLFLEMLNLYTRDFNWAYGEYAYQVVEPTGKMGWGMIMYELIRQGDQAQPVSFYTSLYVRLFPSLQELYRMNASDFSPLEELKLDFRSRFINRFGLWWNFLEIIGEDNNEIDMRKDFKVRRTALAERVFGVG